MRDNFETYENFMLYKNVICNIDRHLILKCENADQFHALVYEEVFNEIVDVYGDSDDILFADGFNEAIIGFEPNMWKVVYSRNKVIEMLMKDMSEEDAIEYAEYNTFNAYVGEKTPLWVDDMEYHT